MVSGALDGRLSGRRALVTGGSRGIGLAVATALSDAGVIVALVARPSASLDEAVRKTGGKALACDVTSGDAVMELPDRARSELDGDPDFVVNAAGGFALSPLAETSPELFEQQLAVTLRGPFLVIRAFLPG